LHRPDRGFRKQGGGVIDAFYDGYALLSGTTGPRDHRPQDPGQTVSGQWFFLVKLDADLSFEPDYFERCLGKFAQDSKLGIGGGLICQEHNGRLTCESPGDPAFHVRGATKIYRRECWDAIGDLVHAPGWDTIDELKANMLGWQTRSFTDIPIRHHRFTGTADGTWRNYVKFGLANYVTGYHPLFMAAKCLRRIPQPPYVTGSLGLAWGFLRGYLSQATVVSDPDLVQYVRRQQISRLLGRPSLWDQTIGEPIHARG
jgi:hypothetical protein